MSTINRKLTKEQRESCQMVTPEFIVSYPHVFKPQQVTPKDTPKYSVTMLFDKNKTLVGTALKDKTIARSLQDIIKNAKICAFGPDKKLWPAELQSPVQDGDKPNKKGEVKEGYPGHWILKATSNEENQPVVVGPQAGPDGKLIHLTKSSEFYAGCYAKAAVFATAWEYMGGIGIKLCFDSVQKVKDGKAFGGRTDINSAFAPISAEGAAGAESEDEGADHDFT